MKTLITVAVVAVVAAFAWLMLPAPPRAGVEAAAGGHAGHAGDPAAISEGTVISVDRAAGNVTIDHGLLRNLGMPPMTMGFQVPEPAILDRLKPGDRVRFHADAVGGAFTATSIEIAN